VPFEVSQQRLLALIASLAGRRIVVAGDFVLDRFIYGYPKRVSREAPVVILRFWKEESLPGGAGNTAANVHSLGGDPVMVGVTGGDEAGRTLREIFWTRGLATDGLLEAPDYRTPEKTRILGGGPHSIKQQIVRYDIEEELRAAEPLSALLRQHLRAAARGADGAILSDYGYGAIAPDAVAVLREVLAAGARICVDSRHRLPEFTGVDAATPNEEELEECAGQPFADSPQRLGAAGEALRARMGCACLLVTRGSQVADVTGAGDTVLAAFALALAAGGNPLEAALLANFAGSVVVMKMGTSIVTPDELRAAVDADRSLLS
jgi:rfaE bifunctional protein kinase chain/domain